MRLRARLALTLVALAVPLVVGTVWLRSEMTERASVQGLADYARMRMVSGGKEACEASPSTFQDPPLPPRMHDGGPPGEFEPFGPPGMRGPGRELDPRPPDVRESEPRPPERNDAKHDAAADGKEPRDPEAHPNRRADERGREPWWREGRGPDMRFDRHRGPNGMPGPRVELWAYGTDFASANARAPKFPDDLRKSLEHGRREAGTIGGDDEMQTTTVAARMSWSEGPCAIVIVRRHEPRPGEGVFVDAIAAGLLALVLLGGVLTAVGPIVKRVRKLEDSVRHSAATNYRDPVAVEGADEVADLAQAFNVAGTEVRHQIEAVEKRERTLRSFVENTTHDVMLPLTVLQGHLTRMRNELSRGASPERDTVREALEESHYLASLVQNLGAAAKLEGGEPDVRRDPFSWNKLVERVILRHKTIAAEKGVELDFAVPDEDVRASGDVTLVEQALSNVVHNAVRYNKSGGHVAMLLTAKDGRFTVRAFDDGPGVPEHELAKIAERSYRTDVARARHPDGLGLGLSIAKDVAERHGFELELKKSEAGGLEVLIRGPSVT